MKNLITLLFLTSLLLSVQAQTIKVGNNIGNPSSGELIMTNATATFVINSLVKKAKAGDSIEFPGHVIVMQKGNITLDGNVISVINPKSMKEGNLSNSRSLTILLLKRQYNVDSSRSKYTLEDYGYKTPQ